MVCIFGDQAVAGNPILPTERNNWRMQALQPFKLDYLWAGLCRVVPGGGGVLYLPRLKK